MLPWLANATKPFGLRTGTAVQTYGGVINISGEHTVSTYGEGTTHGTGWIEYTAPSESTSWVYFRTKQKTKNETQTKVH